MSGFRGWGWRGQGPPLGVPFTLNNQSPQARGLLGWWPPLASPGIGVLRDLSGQNRYAQFSGGVTWGNSPFLGNVIQTDGLDNTYTYATLPPAYGANGWTIAMYVKANNDFKGLFRWGSVCVGYIWTRFAISKVPEASMSVFSTAPWVAGQWYHLVGTWDGNASNPIKLYQDGVDRSGGPINLTVHPGTTFCLGVGYPGYYNNGAYGDVRVYNRALSAAEVWQLWDPDTRWDLYRPLTRRIWYVPIAVGWPRISPQLATVAPQGPRVGGIYVN